MELHELVLLDLRSLYTSSLDKEDLFVCITLQGKTISPPQGKEGTTAACGKANMHSTRAGMVTTGDRVRARAQVWVSPVRPRVIEALLSFTRLEAVRLEAYSSLETACCFSALKHLPALTHLDLRLSGSHYALADNVDALHSLAKCLRLVRPHSYPCHVVLMQHKPFVPRLLAWTLTAHWGSLHRTSQPVP